MIVVSNSKWRLIFVEVRSYRSKMFKVSTLTNKFTKYQIRNIVGQQDQTAETNVFMNSVPVTVSEEYRSDPTINFNIRVAIVGLKEILFTKRIPQGGRTIPNA